MRDGRHDHLVDGHRALMDAEHAGNREAIDVGVDHADLEAHLLEGDREVDGQRRLADTALAGGDGDHARLRGDAQLAGWPWRTATTQLRGERGALVFRHAAELDRHALDAGDRAHLARDVVVDCGLQRAAGNRQRDANGHVAAIDRDALDHVERDEVLFQLGVDHPSEGLADLVFVQRHACRLAGIGESGPGSRSARIMRIWTRVQISTIDQACGPLSVRITRPSSVFG